MLIDVDYQVLMMAKYHVDGDDTIILTMPIMFAFMRITMLIMMMIMKIMMMIMNCLN